MQAHNAFERGTDPELNAGTDPAEKGSVPLFKKRGATAALVICCVLTALWVAFIFSNSLKPAAESSEDSQWLLGLVQKLLPGATEHGLRKAAHFGEFGVLGVLGVLTCIAAWKRRRGPLSREIFKYVWWLPATGVLTAVIDEMLQFFTPGRSAEVLDVLLDTAGFVTGTVIAASIAAAASAIAAARRSRKTDR